MILNIKNQHPFLCCKKQDSNVSKTQTIIWYWNENSNGVCSESIFKIPDLKLIIIKHFKYLNVWSSQNKFRTENKETEYKIDCTMDSITQHRYKAKTLSAVNVLK